MTVVFRPGSGAGATTVTLTGAGAVALTGMVVFLAGTRVGVDVDDVEGQTEPVGHTRAGLPDKILQSNAVSG